MSEERKTDTLYAWTDAQIAEALQKNPTDAAFQQALINEALARLLLK